MGVIDRQRDLMFSETAEGMRCFKTFRTRDELVREKLESELMALIAAKELEMYGLERENAYLRDRLQAEDRRLAHA